MSRDKQTEIEEMASMMLEASTTANVEPVLEIDGKAVVLGENATKILNNILEQAYIPFLAEVLYNAEYRKASEVAEEIFAEMETSFVIGGFVDGKKYIAIREDDYNHYKKKFTEDVK